MMMTVEVMTDNHDWGYPHSVISGCSIDQLRYVSRQQRLIISLSNTSFMPIFLCYVHGIALFCSIKRKCDEKKAREAKPIHDMKEGLLNVNKLTQDEIFFRLSGGLCIFPPLVVSCFGETFFHIPADFSLQITPSWDQRWLILFIIVSEKNRSLHFSPIMRNNGTYFKSLRSMNKHHLNSCNCSLLQLFDQIPIHFLERLPFSHRSQILSTLDPHRSHTSSLLYYIRSRWLRRSYPQLVLFWWKKVVERICTNPTPIRR